MTQQLNYAVFGVGRIGRVHAAIVAEKGHSIVAIGDEADGAIDLTRHVLNLPSVPTFKSPQTMIEAMGEAIDAVIIASHTKDHARHALPFVQVGIPIYLEKPLTDGLEEAFDFVEKIGRFNSLLQIGLQRRYDPALLYTKKLLSEGLIGDGSYLMLSVDIVTSIQEGYKLTIILMDNNGYKSIGALSRSLGSQGFGTRYVFPENNRLPDGAAELVKTLPIDLAANASSLGAHVIQCETYNEFLTALETDKGMDRTTVIYIQNDRYVGVPGYESWWDVPIAEVSEIDTVKTARADYEQEVQKERYFL